MNILFKIVMLNVICLTIIAKKYEIKLLSLEVCKIPEKELDKENSINVTLSSSRIDRKTLIVSSNITVPKKIGPITLNFRAYQLQRSLVRDLEFKLEKLSCNHGDIVKSLSLLNITIDKDCFLLPGNYITHNVTVGEIGEVFSRSVMTSGKYAYELEMHTKNGIISCVGISLEYNN